MRSCYLWLPTSQTNICSVGVGRTDQRTKTELSAPLSHVKYCCVRKCIDGMCKLCLTNCNRVCDYADEFGFLAEALDVFRPTTIAPRGRSSHLAIVGGTLNVLYVWMDGCCELGETVMKFNPSNMRVMSIIGKNSFLSHSMHSVSVYRSITLSGSGAVLGPVHVRFVVDELALRYFFFPEYFGFHLSVRFYQCFILTPIIAVLLREGQVGIAWEPSNNAMLLRISGSIGQKSTSSL